MNPRLLKEGADIIKTPITKLFNLSLDKRDFPHTVELQWLEHLRDYENLFETGVVRATEGLL